MMDRDDIGLLRKFHGFHMLAGLFEKVQRTFPRTRNFSKYAKHDGPCEMPNNQNGTRDTGGMYKFNVHGPPLGSRMHRVTSDTCYNHHGGAFDPKLLVNKLETVMNLFESDNVLEARATQKQIFVHVQQFQSHWFNPTKHAWRVLERAKKTLFKTVNSSSILHGTILLDASNSGTQFYAGFLNVMGALALETSEFHIASELFRKVISIYERSDYTSRSRDLGVAYNNLGCIAVIVGKFKSAEDDLKKSQMFLEELQNESQSKDVEVQLVAVRNNIAKLCLLQRNYAAAVSIQTQLVRLSKDQMKDMLPKGIFVAVLHNYVVLHAALMNFVLVETELEWLRSFCAESEDENSPLANYISVKLCDVKLLLGKKAEDAFGLETIDCMVVSDLHDNLTVASLEGLADMLVHKGKCEAASKVLEDSEQIYRDTCGSNHHHVASVLRKRGSLLRLMGDPCASIECYKGALVILVDMFGSSHPDVLDCCFFLGDQLSCRGMRDESHLHFQRAVENIEVIYQVSFLDHLSVKFLEMTRMEKRMPLMSSKHATKEDGNLIQGLVAEYGLALAVLTSAKTFSKGREEKRKLALNRKKGGIQSRQLFPPFSLKDHSTMSTIPTGNSSLVSTKLVYDLSRSGHSILNHGMAKESAALFRKVCILTRHYRCFDERPDLWPTPFCPIVIVTRPEGTKFFKEKGEMILAHFKELEEAGQRNKNNTEEWEQEFVLKLQNALLVKALTETKVLDVVFDAYDFHSKLSPYDGSFLYVNDGLQVYVSRNTITCNGEKAVYDLLVSTSTVLTGKESKRSCSGSSVMFTPLAYKTGASTDSFLVIAGINSLVDIEYLEQLKHRTLQSVKDIFQRRCFENHRNPTQFLIEVTFPSPVVNVSSGINPSKDLLQLFLFQTLSERRGTVCEIFAERTCERVTCMTFSDGQAASFVFVKALQHLLRNSPDAEIETVSIRNDSVIFSLTAPAKALLTVFCEGSVIKQRTQVLTKTQVQGHSTLTSANCSCFGISNLFCQAAEHCASRFGVSYALSILKQTCSSFPEISDTSVVGDEPVQVWNEEQQARRVLSQSSGEQTMGTTIELHREHIRSLRDCLRMSLFNSSEANSIIYRILDEEESQVKQDALSGNCSSHEEEDSNEGSNLSVQCYASGVRQYTSLFTPEHPSSEVHIQHELNEQESCFPCVDEKEEDSGCELAVEYGRLRFKEDKKKRQRLVADNQQQLQWKRQLESNRHERPPRQSLPVSEGDETSATTRTKTHEAVVDTQNELLFVNTHDNFMSDGSVIKEERLADCGLVDTDSIEMLTVHNSATDCEREAGALTVGSNTTEQTQRSFKDINAANENIDDENSINDCKDPLNGEIIVCEEEQLQNLSTSLTKVQGHATTEVKVSKQRNAFKFDPGIDRQGKIGDSIQEESTVDSQRILGEIFVGHEENEPESKEGATQKNLKHERNEERCSTIKPNTVRHSDEEAEKLSEDGSSRVKGDNQTCIGILGEDFARPKQQLSYGGSSFTGGKGFGDLITCDTANTCQNFNDSCVVGMVSERIRPGEDNSWKEIDSKAVIQRKTVAHAESRDVNDKHIASMSIANQDVVDGPITQTGVYQGSNTKVQTSWDFKTKKKTQRASAYTIEEGHSFSKNIRDRHSQIWSISRSTFSGRKMTNKNYNDEPLQHHTSFLREMSPDKTKRLANPWVLGGARPKTKTKPVPVGSKSSEGVQPGFLARHAISKESILSDSSYTNAGLPTLWEDQRKGSTYFDHNTLTDGNGELTKGFREITSFENSVKLPARNESLHSEVDQNWHFPSLLINDGPLPEGNLCNESSKITTREARHRPYDIDWSGYGNGDAVRDSTITTWNCSLHRLRDHFLSIVEQNESLQELSTKLLINNSSPNSQSNSDPELVATQEQLTVLREEIERTIHLAALREKERQEKQEKEVEREKAEAAVRDREAEGRGNAEARGSSELSQEDQCRPTKAVAIRAPVQESPHFVCEHYQRRCLVQFPCCNKFYPCHRCHNESNACTEDQLKGVDATHFKCTVCNHRQEIDEGGQRCRKCNTKMAEYFCAICKHFTAVDKNPFHCFKCGICRIHKERSFHCDVCDVCLDKRLQGNHKCRPNSGHDECCICLEDAFGGCQILPCSHKVHKDCAIAMVRNGIRTCPICRHPLSVQLPGGTE